MTDKLLEPTPEEHAYHLGWLAYHAGLMIGMNPYSPDDETIFYDQYDRGWMNAQLGDSD